MNGVDGMLFLFIFVFFLCQMGEIVWCDIVFVQMVLEVVDWVGMLWVWDY